MKNCAFGCFFKCVFVLLFVTSVAQASITLSGTRVIFPSERKDVSVSMKNESTSAFLVQSWVEIENNKKSKAPFFVAPALVKLEGKRESVLRLMKLQDTFAKDRESLYWLNVKAIPGAVKGENILQIAVVTRVKVLYRPKGLQGDVAKAFETLQWSMSPLGIVVKNPSPYYVNVGSVQFNGRQNKEIGYFAPFSEITIPSKLKAPVAAVLTVINDYGRFVIICI